MSFDFSKQNLLPRVTRQTGQLDKVGMFALVCVSSCVAMQLQTDCVYMCSVKSVVFIHRNGRSPTEGGAHNAMK